MYIYQTITDFVLRPPPLLFQKNAPSVTYTLLAILNLEKYLLIEPNITSPTVLYFLTKFYPQEINFSHYID